MHWKAPTTLILAYVAGVGFAIGHHFFYQSLNGKHVDSTAFDQQINTGIGTAFAFLVRTCLVLAVGVAFTQVLWRDLLQKPIKVSRIDSMTQLLTSAVDMFNLRTLWKHPILAFLAFVSWTLPTAIVIPPATLTVSKPTEAYRNYTLTTIPTVDYTTTSNFMVRTGKYELDYDNGTSVLLYQGSSAQLARLALGVAVRGEIALIPPPAQDSLYSLRFYGPAIQCTDAPAAILNDFEALLGCSTPACMLFSYIAWVPSPTHRVPFNSSIVDDNFVINFTPSSSTGYADGFTTVGGYETEPAALYIYIFDDISAPVLNCSLHNASYTATFEFSGGSQTLNVTKELLEGMPFKLRDELPLDQVEREISNTLSYQAVMDSFGKILVGSVISESSVDATLVLSTNLRICSTDQYWFNRSCVRTMAEQLFENITLSLFSSAEFTNMNSTTDVTLLTYPDTYVYSWERLALAYGLAILFAGICVVIGGISIINSRESYSYTFSTIMRTIHQQEIDNYIRDEDRNGADPRPKRLGKAKITIGRTSQLGCEKGNSPMLDQAVEGDSLLRPEEVLRPDQGFCDSQSSPRLSLMSTGTNSIHLPFENPNSCAIYWSKDSISTASSLLPCRRQSQASSKISATSSNAIDTNNRN